MHGPDAAGPSPFEARRRGEHLRVTVMKQHTPPPHRYCERSEAIQTASAEGLWMASLRSQRRKRYSADSRTIWRPPLISFRLLTKFSGRCQRLGTFRPIYSAMSPMKPVQLVVSAFQTGELAFSFSI